MHPCDQASWRLNWESQRSRSASLRVGEGFGWAPATVRWGRLRLRERGEGFWMENQFTGWSLSNRGHNEAGGITGNNECQHGNSMNSLK